MATTTKKDFYNNTIWQNFVENLKKIKGEMTIDDFAGKYGGDEADTGLTESVIKSWIDRAIPKEPSLSNAVKMAKALGVSLDALCGRNDIRDFYAHNRSTPEGKAERTMNFMLDILDDKNADWGIAEKSDFLDLNDCNFNKLKNTLKESSDKTSKAMKEIAKNEDFWVFEGDNLIKLVEELEHERWEYRDCLDALRKIYKPYDLIIGSKLGILESFINEYTEVNDTLEELANHEGVNQKTAEKLANDNREVIIKKYLEKLTETYSKIAKEGDRK